MCEQPILKPGYLTAESLDNISDIMTGQAGILGYGTDYSFINRLAALVPLDNTLIPDVVAVTMNSAVPVADAVRGAYDAADITCPQIIAVESNTLSRSLHEELPHLRELELERLQQLVKDAKSAVVIDQCYVDGFSIGYAADLLEEAGIQRISLIRGKWYGDVVLEDINVSDVTSVYADRFKAIGRKSFELYSVATL